LGLFSSRFCHSEYRKESRPSASLTVIK